MMVFSFLFHIGCLTANITKGPGDFPDNPTDDYDQDGLAEQDGDCDDLNNQVLGPTEWHADSDGDGFGDPNQAIVACQSELLALDDAIDYVENADDCNDSDASIFPNNARYEADGLCVVDADGDGYGDANPSVGADYGTDCDDSDAAVYPGYNNEQGILCILDADGDGFGVANAPQPYDSGTDCDDGNAEIHPARTESCDGVDNDCNGLMDDYQGLDAPIWYADSDGDGYGDPELSVHNCNPPALHVSNSTDCDDSSADVYPNAPEYCDGIDSNCNGLLDDDAALDAPQWYTDVDGDGYGSSATVVIQCAQPTGFVADNTDCNDFSSEQYPGAPEQCNQQDDSCDGQIDEGVLLTFYTDGDGDGYGNLNQPLLACAVPPGGADNADDCNDGSALIRPGAAELCNNIDDDCDTVVDNNAIDMLTFYQDADGDGRGTSTESIQSCPDLTGIPTAPDGYSYFDDDCDDGDANRSPILPELCTASVDENCDGDPEVGAVDVQTFFADNDGDGQGNTLYSISLCSMPFGYVDNADDCNDTDAEVLSGMPEAWEICNGKLDRCEDDDGSLTPPDVEVDNDEDGYVECTLDVNFTLWAGAAILGDGDCEDDDGEAYPGAPEKCNGVVENFSGDGLCADSLSSEEADLDGDGFVECSYDPLTWEGSVSVIGGADCNDDRPNAEFTFPGAAPLTDPLACLTDVDGDGEGDCVFSTSNPIQSAPNDYFCDVGVFVSDDVGPDFVWIPSGDDPLGRYSISFDFYMMTTEVTQAMWDLVMSSVNGTSMLAKHTVNWYEAAMFSNALSLLEGRESCYTCSGSVCTEAIIPITDCMGYRLPTQWEWEYAARSGTTKGFWTGEGVDLGGDISGQSCDDGGAQSIIIDGASNPLLDDFAWICLDPNNEQAVAQKRPNGFGLYDMHGNVRELTADHYDGSASVSGVNPWYSNGADVVLRGGSYFDSYPGNSSSGAQAYNSFSFRTFDRGFRLVRRAP